MITDCAGGSAVEDRHDAKRPLRRRRRRDEVTVDIHCHLEVPAANELLSRLTAGQTPNAYRTMNALTLEINRRQGEELFDQLTDARRHIEDMDAQGIDVQALSPSPFHYNYDYLPEVTDAVAHLVNDRIAAVCAEFPDRFVGMGTVPLQEPDLALTELERCVTELGFRGVEVSTHVNGRELTRAGLERFFGRMQELGVVLFVHPMGTSVAQRMEDHYFANTIGHPLESTLAIGHLVFDGYIDRFPDLKICVSHGGGYAPMYHGRFDHPYEVRDDCRVNITRAPSEIMRSLYFDTVVFTEAQLRYLVDTWGAEHVVLGTDYPYDMAETDPIGFVDRTAGLSDEQRSAIVGGNALRLLGLDAASFARP